MLWLLLAGALTVSTSAQQVRAIPALVAMAAFGAAGLMISLVGLPLLWAGIAFVVASATLWAGKVG